MSHATFFSRSLNEPCPSITWAPACPECSPFLLYPPPSLWLHNSAKCFAFYYLFHKKMSLIFSRLPFWVIRLLTSFLRSFFVSPTVLYLCFFIVCLSQRNCKFLEERNYVLEADMPWPAIEPCLEYLFNKCLPTKYMKALPTHPYSFPSEIY